MASITILPKRDVPRVGPSLDRRTSALALAGVSCAVALSGVVALTSGAVTPPGGGMVLPVLVSVAVAMGLVTLWVVLRVRRSASRVDSVQCPTNLLDHESTTVEDGSRQDPESLALRTLRAQVRTLEQALEQEQRHFAPAVPSSDQSDVAAFRRDVLLTVKALGARTATDEGGRHTLARLTAAIERLDAGDTFARPVLAPAATVMATPTRPKSRIVAAAPLPEEGTPAAAGDAGSTVPVEESVPDDADHLDVVDETPSDMASSLPPLPTESSEVVEAAPQVVLPVPSLMTDSQAQRGRRWFRRTAA